MAGPSLLPSLMLATWHSRWVIYAIWKVEVKLVGNKARVVADWNKNTVRQGLNGALLYTRLLVRTVRAMDIKPERVWIMGHKQDGAGQQGEVLGLLHRLLQQQNWGNI